MNTEQQALPRNRPPRLMLTLIMVLPLLSVLAISVMFLLASQISDLGDASTGAPLNKTSWQKQP